MFTFFTFLILVFWIYSLSSKSKDSFLNILLKQRVINKTQFQKIYAYEQKKRLKNWYQNGFLEERQYQEILRSLDENIKYLKMPVHPTENIKNEEKQNILTINWLFNFVCFAVGCIGLGIIAVVAANWNQIPMLLKLIGYFVCFLGLLAWLSYTYINSSQKYRLKEFLLWCNIGWIFIGIALIGQLFHLTGNTWTAVFFGMILSVPFIWASSFSQSKNIWLIFYGLSAILSSSQAYATLWILMVLPLVWKYKNNLLFCAIWWITLILSVIKSYWFVNSLDRFFNLFMPVAGTWMILTVLLALLFLIKWSWGAKTAFFKVAKYGFICLTFFSVFVNDVFYSENDVVFSSDKLIYSIWGVFALMVIPFGLIGIFMKQKRHLWHFWAVSVVVAIIYSFLENPFWGMVLSLIYLLCLAIYFAHNGHMKGFNFVLSVMIVRVVWQYIDLVVSLMTTGIGLIVTGVVLLMGIFFYSYIYPYIVKQIKNGGKNE